MGVRVTVSVTVRLRDYHLFVVIRARKRSKLSSRVSAISGVISPLNQSLAKLLFSLIPVKVLDRFGPLELHAS